MNHVETSRHLALAIGYLPEQMQFNALNVCEVLYQNPFFGLSWRRFDYRDPVVIWQVAERYNVFPVRAETGVWDVPSVPMFGGADTAAKAVALAVICQGPT